MNWKHGYYADSGYTYGFYAETTPARLAWAALTQGHIVPLSNFRYLDAGCGQGLSLIFMAAAHPESEFVGVDFLPEHIAHAEHLAKACGLTNVQFIEGDFIELAREPSTLGSFDFVVCHGITSWIAPSVKQALFSLVGQVLKPGGLFYNSYNTLPGWLSGVPFQHLVLLEQRSKTGSLALQAARGHMESLQDGAPGLFAVLPTLQNRLKAMESQDPAYLLQEYNNTHWQPIFVSQMMDEMAAVKLSYLGTATLPEAYDLPLAVSIRELLAKQTVPVVREQLRDYALNQSFRRDLYVKGQRRPWPKQVNELLRTMRFAINPTVPRPPKGENYVIKAGSIELSGDEAFYGSVLNTIANAPEGVTVAEVINSLQTPQHRNNIVFVLSMLLHGGWVTQHLPDAPSAKQINSVLTRAVSQGAPYKYFSLPSVGGALQAGDAELLLLNCILKGDPEEKWSSNLQASLSQLGRNLLGKDGKAVTEPAQLQRLIEVSLDDFKKTKLPFYRRMGAV